LIKKTAAKKTMTKKAVKVAQDIREILNLSKDLELDLQKLQKKIKALPHDPHIYGPKRSPKK
jgi:hypothetical protein